MSQEKLKFGAQPTFDGTGLGNASTRELCSRRPVESVTPIFDLGQQLFGSQGHLMVSFLRSTKDRIGPRLLGGPDALRSFQRMADLEEAKTYLAVGRAVCREPFPRPRR